MYLVDELVFVWLVRAVCVCRYEGRRVEVFSVPIDSTCVCVKIYVLAIYIYGVCVFVGA